jgi:expansin
VCRTPCKYGGKSIAFRVNEGSTNFWLSLLVEFEDGEGDIGSMQIKQVINQRTLQPASRFFRFRPFISGSGPFSSSFPCLVEHKTVRVA